MTNAICFIFDQNYLQQGLHAVVSAKKHNPYHKTVLLIDGEHKPGIADIEIDPAELGLTKENWLLVGRIAVVEYALTTLHFETAIFVDGDTYSYYQYSDLQNQLKTHSLIVIPHITKPLPNDGQFPQNRIISLSGNYNTGVWAASKDALDFIAWWKEQTTLFPITRPDAGLVNEQGWLRFAGDFHDNTKIFRHPGYNVAYWNIKQRHLEEKNDTIHIDNKPLCIMHFSGLKKEVPPKNMSVFQNRYVLDQNDLAYKLYNDYYKLIWS